MFVSILILGFENMQIEQHTHVVHIMVISVTFLTMIAYF